jgi:hypothetical protein
MINTILFPGKGKVVGESKADFFSDAKSPPQIRVERAIPFFGYFLYHSEFGKRIMEGTPAGPSLVQLQKFLFRLCELRKANTAKPRMWRPKWKDAGKRAKQNAKHREGRVKDKVRTMQGRHVL